MALSYGFLQGYYLTVLFHKYLFATNYIHARQKSFDITFGCVMLYAYAV
jgi:hypothetical protein